MGPSVMRREGEEVEEADHKGLSRVGLQRKRGNEGPKSEGDGGSEPQ